MTPVLLAADEALFFVTELEGGDAAQAHALDEALQRMAVAAARRRVVALADEPELGAHWQVRVTPCLVLNTGLRQVLLLGDLARLDPARLELALSQR